MTGTLNGETIADMTLTVPRWGPAWATVELQGDAATPATPRGAIVDLAGLTFTGTVFRAFNFAGRNIARIVGGADGWRRPVPARGYDAKGAGLSLASIIGDAAGEVGELVGPALGTVGAQYARRAANASQVFDLIPAGQGWWIDGLGVTQIGTRPSGMIVGPFELVSYSGDSGLAVIATDTPAEWLPGVKFGTALAGPFEISSIVWRLQGGSFRGDIWTA